MLTSNDFARFKLVFEGFDEDKDGFIAFPVLEEALRSLGLNPTAEELEDMQLEVGRRPISFNVFLYIAFRHSRHVDVEDEVIKIFRLFDRGRTGRLPAQKVKEILRRYEKPFTPAQISDVLSQADVQDGLVDYENMVRAVLAT
jgi:Ca2+-binding EF-hand superfamily protein